MRVGPDTVLIRMFHQFGASSAALMKDLRDVEFDRILELEELVSYHILDVGNSNPLGYSFRYYGRNAHIMNKRSFQSQQVGDASWEALREFGVHAFAKNKEASQPEFSRVKYTYSESYLSYRRLSLPFSDNGREVSHLLVTILRD